MRFDFQQMKPLLQQEFDAVLDRYPTDLSHLTAQIPTGGDPFERKRILVSLAAQHCPVHLFPHYPFAFELDVGEPREVCYVGIGNRCRDQSGVDFTSLHALRSAVGRCALGGFNDYSDHIHRTLDHDKLLAVGFRGVYEDCARRNETETDPEKKRWRELLMDCCRSVERIGLRLRALAKERLPNAADEDERYNLERIVRSVNTPWEPPETFFDALNAILCTTLWISGLDGVEMNAYGAIDRLLWPFYQRDLQAGRLTEEEAYFLLQCFLHKTDLHCHFNETRKTYDNGVSVAIGGCDLEGQPVYNAVTDLVLRAYTDNRLINPKLNARASAQSPAAYIEKLAALMRTGNNNLVVENDDYIIPMFLRMGLAPEDARTYIGNGCQEVICRNQIHSRAFVYWNLPQILLDTLFCSPDTLDDARQLLYRGGCFRCDTFEALYASFFVNLRACLQTLADTFAPFERIHLQICPETLLSAFTDDCVAKGRDLADGGARYTHKTFSMFGFGTLCDSLLCLRRAYAEGTVDALLQAVRTDFADNEPMRQRLLHQPGRFGHSEAANAFAASLADDLAQVTRGIRNGCGVEWGTSLFTYFNYHSYGAATGATPDGRHAGEPLSRQMNMASVPELTTAALSMAVLTKADFHDVGMFDIALPATVSDNQGTLRALTDYIRTCLSLQIPVLQPNVADRQTMLEERQHKGTHPDLVVRVCGYSAIFGGLPEDMQDEIIARLASASAGPSRDLRA